MKRSDRARGDEGQPEDQEKEHQPDGASVAHVPVIKGVLIQVGGNEQHRLLGTAAAVGHHVGNRENLKRADQTHDRIEVNHRRDHRQRDVHGLLPETRPVDLRRLVQRPVARPVNPRGK